MTHTRTVIYSRDALNKGRFVLAPIGRGPHLLFRRLIRLQHPSPPSYHGTMWLLPLLSLIHSSLCKACLPQLTGEGVRSKIRRQQKTFRWMPFSICVPYNLFYFLCQLRSVSFQEWRGKGVERGEGNWGGGDLEAA
jgi:hypothetical protein